MRLRPAVLLTAVMVLFAPAGSALADEEKVDCENPMSTYEMNVCSERDLEKADAALNAIYKKALASIEDNGMEPPFDSKTHEEAMRAAQRAWVAYRDADCKGLLPQVWTGGSGTTSAVNACLIDKTQQRTSELKDRYGLE